VQSLRCCSAFAPRQACANAACFRNHPFVGRKIYDWYKQRDGPGFSRGNENDPGGAVSCAHLPLLQAASSMRRGGMGASFRNIGQIEALTAAEPD